MSAVPSQLHKSKKKFNSSAPRVLRAEGFCVEVVALRPLKEEV